MAVRCSLRWARLRTAALAVLAASIPLVAAAGSLSVAPIRLDLAGGTIARLDITNQGTEPTVVQLSAARWTQQVDGDRHEPTEALLFNPPLFRIAAGQTRIVRIAAPSVPAGSEAAYRLFVAEVPQPEAHRNGSLHVALRLSLPVFVGEARREPALGWRLEADGQGGWSVVATNGGGRHARLNALAIATDAADRAPIRSNGPQYVLAGATRGWPLGPLPTGSTVRVAGEIDGRPVDARLVVGQR